MSQQANIPSHAQGFAHFAAEAQRPDLWEGLRGLWAPCLGPTGSTLYDFAGAGNRGAMVAGMTAVDAWKTDQFGPNIRFDGSDDGIIITDPAALRTAHCTIAAWCTREVSSSLKYLYRHITNVGGNLCAVRIQEASSYLYFTIYVDGFERTVQASKSTYFPVSTWTLVTGTWDGYTQRLYMNGRQIQETTGFSGDITHAAGCDVQFGRKDTSYYWNGKLGMLAVFDHEIAPQQIMDLYVDPFAILRLRRKVLIRVPGGGAGQVPVFMDHYSRLRRAS